MSIQTPETSVASSSQSHLLHIPKLDENGLNFIVWKARAKSSFEARGLWKHVEGRGPIPDSLTITKEADGSVTYKLKGAAADIEVTQKVIDDFEAKYDEWHQKQALVRAQLFGSIPNSLLIEIQGLENASRMWDAVCNRFTSRTGMHVIDLRRQLFNMRCTEEGDLREHLAELIRLREVLAGLGELISDKEFGNTIVGSLPES